MSLIALLNVGLKLCAVVGACMVLWTYKRSVVELYGWMRCLATAILAIAIAVAGNHYLGQFPIYQREFWVSFDESDVATTFFLAFGIGMMSILVWGWMQARMKALRGQQNDD